MNKSKCPAVQSPYTVNPRNPCNIYVQTKQGREKKKEKKMEAKAISSKPSSHQTTQQNHVPPPPPRYNNTFLNRSIDRRGNKTRDPNFQILSARYKGQMDEQCNIAFPVDQAIADVDAAIVTLVRPFAGAPCCSYIASPFPSPSPSTRGTTADAARHANKQWIHEYENFHENSPAVYPRRGGCSQCRDYISTRAPVSIDGRFDRRGFTRVIIGSATLSNRRCSQELYDRRMYIYRSVGIIIRIAGVG